MGRRGRDGEEKELWVLRVAMGKIARMKSTYTYLVFSNDGE